MFLDFTREREIRRTLRKLAKQRIAMVLQPGDHRVLEKAIDRDAHTEAILYTCEMRGWIEPLHEAVPVGALVDGKLTPDFKFDRVETMYKLTSAGWSVIHRSYQIALLAILISVISVGVSVVSFFLSMAKH